MALLQIGAHQLRELGDALGSLGFGCGGRAKLLTDVCLHDFGHEAVDGTTDGSDLLQHRSTVGIGVECANKGITLTTYAAHTRQHAFFFQHGMWHESSP